MELESYRKQWKRWKVFGHSVQILVLNSRKDILRLKVTPSYYYYYVFWQNVESFSALGQA